MDTLRKPFFIAALILILIALLVEIGSSAKLAVVSSSAATLGAGTPGKGIPALAFLDGLLLFTSLLMGLGLLVPERLQGRLQGLATLIFSFLMLGAEIVMIFAAIALLVLMITLLLAPIFGTIAYFIIYGNFDTGAARVTLGVVMTLKLLFALCLIMAQQRFLQNKGLVLLTLTTLLATFVVAFLQGMVPGFLVSITDDIGAIVALILAAIWTAVFLISSLVSVAKAVA
ncbi:MAG TPA: hypothetical protein VI455_07695 [Terriglobia bacterium]